jgi:hypothetical protein
MRLFISFVVGLVFGIGLYVSGMTQPSKLQGFLGGQTSNKAAGRSRRVRSLVHSG